MTTIEEVVKTWNKEHSDMPIEKQGYRKRKGGEIRKGSMYGRRNNEAVIKLSKDFGFEPWHNRTCYVFGFKYDATDELAEIYIHFERRIIEDPNTKKFYEFLGSIRTGSKPELELSQGRINPNHIVLGRKLDLNLSAKDICNSMNELIVLTQKKICDFLTGKPKQKRKLNSEQKKMLNKILNKHDITDDGQYSKCEEIFLLAEDILKSLFVTEKDFNELNVSYYTKKSIAGQLLKVAKETNERNEFRLYYTFGMNDPLEGKVLLPYLLGMENKPELKLPENIPFIACFSLETDNLNQFRLYGKEENKEATGVGILFKRSFFKSRNHKLYRCIYMNPDNEESIHVSLSKKEYKIREDKIREGNEIDDKSKEVESMLEELKELCERLKEDKLEININKLLADLLIKILYLVKDCAFEEERECRIIDLKDKKDKSIKVDEKRLYVRAGKIKRHIDKIYFAPLAEGMEAFEIENGIECIRSRNPFCEPTLKTNRKTQENTNL